MLKPIFFCSLVLPVLATAAPLRVHQRFDDGWLFQLDNSIVPAKNDIPTWKWRALPDGWDTNLSSLPDSNEKMATAQAGEDIFHGRRGFALLSATVTAHYPGKTGVLHFESVDDNATVYINNHRVLYHEGWNDPFDVPLTGIANGQIFTVDVVDENTDGPGGIGSTYFGTPEDLTAPKQAEPGLDDSRWRSVHLPHDYVIEGKFSPDADPGHGALPRGVGWYRKSFTLPATAKNSSVWLDFDGAFTDAHVWLNGRLVGSHRSGYTGFRIDLAPAAHFGAKNVLAVRLDARKTEGWWYEGGGIYRHVWLTIADPVHVAPMGGVFVTTACDNPLAAQPKATVTVQTEIDNDSGRNHDVRLDQTLLRPDGTTVGVVGQNFPGAGSTSIVQLQLSEPNARLWSLEHPQLYKLVTRVYSDGRPIDEVVTPFGIRTLRWDPNQGFFLNEKPVKLKGTCNHQDFAGVGIGMPDRVLEWRIRKLKEMGSNAYRCSHNEVAPELLDACDRLGMLVMDENREFGDTWSGKANPHTTTNDLSDLRQEVLRDRNHPSVIMWSIANEEFAVQTDPAGARIAKALSDAVKALDPTRPVTAALNGGHGSYMSQVLDLEGFNYGPGEYPSYHKSHPDHPMFGSETASTVTDRGEYADDPARGYVKGYDVEGSNTAEDAWEPIAEEPYNGGGFVWTGFDYKGEPSPYGWPCVNSHFGILDLCGFPKDNYYYYKAWWGDKPLVHIEPHWNWAGSEGKPIDVWVFGNGDAVNLTLNGKSLGVKHMPRYRHLEWQVPYTPGTLIATSYSNGKVVAMDKVVTTGQPVALKVTSLWNKLQGDNEDSAMLEVSVVDANGRVVPNASNLIQFSVTGPAWIAGVGNGDPSCHEPDRASLRHAFHGLALGIVQAKAGAGQALVTISSAGLKPVTYSITVVPAGSR